MYQTKFTVSTLGCKVNHQESEKLISDMISLGYQLAKPNESAEICIINSCTVTSIADAKTRQRIRQARSKNPDAFICVIGCMPEVSHDSVLEMEEVDYVIGNKEKENAAQLIEKKLPFQNQHSSEIDEKPEKKRTRAFLKIEDGCDRFCAYCIIPYARGKVRSKPVDEILTEVKSHLNLGYREIVLSGINLALYGTDLTADKDAAVSLYSLLKELTTLDSKQDYRIRLGSLEPTVLTTEEALSIAALPRICPHFHLSLQSGSNNTLRAMGRNYDTQTYLDTVLSLRKTDPDFAITTDVIVGFPGETEEDFNESLAFVKEVNFSKVHVFPYSVREGTRAANMENQVPDSIKKIRTAKMIEAGNTGAQKFFQGCINKQRLTLIFGTDRQGYIRGLTDNGIDVRFPKTGASSPTENDIIDLLLTPDIADLTCNLK